MLAPAECLSCSKLRVQIVGLQVGFPIGDGGHGIGLLMILTEPELS